ncbi:unnamed protein product [Symbiodinium sp. KB8]|nr:unnamed protein product [Symbiodinium sp. KB8]
MLWCSWRGRRKASTEDGEEELSMNPLSREEIFIRTFPGEEETEDAAGFRLQPHPTAEVACRCLGLARGLFGIPLNVSFKVQVSELLERLGSLLVAPSRHLGAEMSGAGKPRGASEPCEATQRGDKLRESICPGPSELLVSLACERGRAGRARAEPTGAEMRRDVFGFELRALKDLLLAPVSGWGYQESVRSGGQVATSPASVAQLSQMTQVLAPPKMELSLSGACLDLLVAPGDVLLMRGSGRLAEIGNAGGFMGHVLVVTGKPREVLASTAEAGQLASLWPEKAQAIWRIPTLESTRREQGLWEAESVIMVERLGRQLTLVGEVERDGDVCNFEPHEAVEIWQSPEELRGALRVDLMALVLSDMRKNQASWSATTAARAARSPKDSEGKVPEAQITPPLFEMPLGQNDPLGLELQNGLYTVGSRAIAPTQACAIDAADKALLPATFGALADQLQVGPTQLAMLNFAQSIAFSLALPVWGSMMQFYTPRDLLAGGCFLWGFVTMMIAASSNYMVHFLLRLVMGAALAVVAPIGQAMLCDLVPEAERGWVFGLLQSISTALSVGVTFVTTGFARVLIAGVYGWRCIYALVGIASFLTVAAVVTVVPDTLAASGMNTKGRSWWEEQVRVVQLVMKKPSFVIMVSQGVTGGIPWNGFAFLPLYFQLSGFNDFRAGEIMLYGGLGGMVGGLLGGWLGDRFHRCWPYGGRCVVAQLSVLLGSLFFVAVMSSPARFSLVVGFFFAFHVASCWTPAAALRPICGEIVRDSRDRAQILALWIALEGIISSIFGAPLVGLISEAFGCKLGALGTAGHDQSVTALRSALLAVALIPWVLCGLAWFPMYWTYPRDAGSRTETRAICADTMGVLSSAEMVEKPTASQTLEGVKKCWESAPICTSVVINFWQRYLEKLACHSFLQQPDPSLGAGFNPGDKISYWDLSCGTWVSGFVKESSESLTVKVTWQLPTTWMFIKPSANPQYIRRRLNEADFGDLRLFGFLLFSTMPPAAPQNLPVFAFPQNQSRSGGQLPVFAFPGREPGQPGQPPSSPSALPIFAPAGGLAGLGAVPGMALPQQLTPRTPRTPRDEQTSPTAQVAPSPSSPSQPPQEPVQEVQDSEVEWRNLRKGITTSTEGFANEEEGLKEVLSPGDESIDFEEFSDIRFQDPRPLRLTRLVQEGFCSLNLPSLMAILLLAFVLVRQLAPVAGTDDSAFLQLLTSRMPELQGRQSPSFSAYLDFTLADAARACGAGMWGGSSGIDEKAWDCIFPKLDLDGDGSITPSDVAKASWLQGSVLVKRLNISKQDCREATALLATWYPKLAPFLVRHAQEVLLSAWTGVKPFEASEPREQDLALAAYSAGSPQPQELLELSDCQEALLETVPPVLNLATSVVGLSLPHSAAEAVLKRVSLDASFLAKVHIVVSELGGPDKILKNTEATTSFVFRIAAELWNDGVLATAMDEIRLSMSWWDWVSTAVPMIASLSSFFLTGSTLNLVIALGLGGVNVVNLGKALTSTAQACELT